MTLNRQSTFLSYLQGKPFIRLDQNGLKGSRDIGLDIKIRVKNKMNVGTFFADSSKLVEESRHFRSLVKGADIAKEGGCKVIEVDGIEPDVFEKTIRYVTVRLNAECKGAAKFRIFYYYCIFYVIIDSLTILIDCITRYFYAKELDAIDFTIPTLLEMYITATNLDLTFLAWDLSAKLLECPTLLTEHDDLVSILNKVYKYDALVWVQHQLSSQVNQMLPDLYSSPKLVYLEEGPLRALAMHSNQHGNQRMFIDIIIKWGLAQCGLLGSRVKHWSEAEFTMLMATIGDIIAANLYFVEYPRSYAHSKVLPIKKLVWEGSLHVINDSEGQENARSSIQCTSKSFDPISPAASEYLQEKMETFKELFEEKTRKSSLFEKVKRFFQSLRESDRNSHLYMAPAQLLLKFHKQPENNVSFSGFYSQQNKSEAPCLVTMATSERIYAVFFPSGIDLDVIKFAIYLMKCNIGPFMDAWKLSNNTRSKKNKKQERCAYATAWELCNYNKVCKNWISDNAHVYGVTKSICRKKSLKDIEAALEGSDFRVYDIIRKKIEVGVME
ncbi:2233_t:CDS:1 [Paraglomus occultum]|uniref:2233_t:CDS:1 n=1 Tax=Paraglomus occultum TaxID=144539 RepID=A0A9N9DGA4_9GLOM|nr:2233_t:CDS:1 [Paraglomus occultum]